MDLSLSQWICVGIAALLVGISKTGVPGMGIMVVPILAIGFGGRLGAGVMLPMLIVGDIFAVCWYGKHIQWDKLTKLFAWVGLGILIGTYFMWVTGKAPKGAKNYADITIGILVLVMIALHLLRKYFGEKITPKSGVGRAVTGVAAGFSTLVSNAAGPIMQVYMASHKLSKKDFMGTNAVYFLIVNVSKFPIYVVLSRLIPREPIVTVQSLSLNLMIAPVIIGGVYLGKWIFPRISQKAFESAVLILSAAGAIQLLVSAIKK